MVDNQSDAECDSYPYAMFMNNTLQNGSILVSNAPTQIIMSRLVNARESPALIGKKEGRMFNKELHSCLTKSEWFSRLLIYL